jgi:hypothetical protein
MLRLALRDLDHMSSPVKAEQMFVHPRHPEFQVLMFLKYQCRLCPQNLWVQFNYCRETCRAKLDNAHAKTQQWLQHYWAV